MERKLSEILSEHVEPMSPLAIDYQGERFASASGTNKSRVEPTSGDMTTLDKTRTLDGSNARYMECAHGARDSWVNINVVSKEGVNGEQERLDVLSESGGGFPGGSLDRVGLSVLTVGGAVCSWSPVPAMISNVCSC